MEKTIAEMMNHDFKNGKFELFNDDGQKTYFEMSDRFWIKCEYKNNKMTRYKNSFGADLKFKGGEDIFC